MKPLINRASDMSADPLPSANDNHDPAAYSPEQKKLVFTKIKRVTGIAIPPAEQTPAVTRMADLLLHKYQTDTLTKAATLDYFKHTLANILKLRTQDNGISSQTQTVIFCDFDHFKKINDFLGHTRANSLIQEMADFLQKSTRHYPSPGHSGRAPDVLARFGGDEFVILMHGCNEEQAKARMTTIADMLRQETFHFGKRSVTNLGLSFGCHEIAPTPKKRRHQDYYTIATHAIDAANEQEKEYKKRPDKQEPTFIHNGSIVWSQAMREQGLTYDIPPLDETSWQRKIGTKSNQGHNLPG
jgi:diguanylate cyclase (GGDEF)-like protein